MKNKPISPNYPIELLARRYDSLKEKYTWIRELPEVSFSHFRCYNYINKMIWIDNEFDIQEGDTVIDGGSFNGMNLPFLSQKVGDSGQVIAFECDPFSYAGAFKLSLDYNNIKVFPIALWSKEDILKFYINTTISANTLMRDRPNITDKYYTVIGKSIDELSEIIGLDKIKFIKLNIEGAELEALKGCVNIIKRDKPQFLIHTHELNGKLLMEDVSKFLEDFDYEVTQWTKTIIIAK